MLSHVPQKYMSKIICLQPWSTVLSLCEINLFMPSFNIYYVTVGVSGANTLRERECLPIRVNIEPELLQKTEPPPLLTAIKHSSFPERFESRLCPLPTELFWRFYSFIWKKKWAKEQYLKGCCESLMKLHSAIVPRTHDTRKSIIFLTHWLDHTYHGSSPAQPHYCAALSIVLFWFLILMTTP